MLIFLEAMAEDSAARTDALVLEPLLLKLADGEQSALAELYCRTKTAVYGLAVSYLKHTHDAEDVTQDTFVALWEKAYQYRPQGTPLAWILKIARNLALMKLREQGKTQDIEPEAWERMVADHPLVTVEDRHVLQAALSGLSDHERQVVILHAVTGWKHREIAELLELPLATVLSKYRRALQKLKNMLDREER